MNELDIRFFEEYKKADKLCKDIFLSDIGISTYIEEMEKISIHYDVILGWRDWYYTLKHLRWVRNQIAHSSDDYGFSNEKDLNDIINFTKCILELSDPYTAYIRRINKRAIKSMENTAKPHGIFYKIKSAIKLLFKKQ